MDAPLDGTDGGGFARSLGRSMSFGSAADSEWISRAEHAEIWTVCSEGRMFEAYTYDGDIRWVEDEALPSQIQFMATNGANVWAISKDGKIYLRLSQAQAAATDKITNEIYENQRWTYSAWGTNLLSFDRPAWSDITGKIKMTKEDFVLPSTRWQWDNNTIVPTWTYTRDSATDSAGWSYAHNFPNEYHATQQASDFVRRRKHFCHRRSIPVQNPWIALTQDDQTSFASIAVASEEFSSYVKKKRVANGEYSGSLDAANARHGVGEYVAFIEGAPDRGDTYRGMYIHDIMQGYGTYTYANGNRYEGLFQNGIYDGFGTFYFSNGDKFEGYYKDGKETGVGLFTTAKGIKEIKFHDNGTVLEGTSVTTGPMIADFERTFREISSSSNFKTVTKAGLDQVAVMSQPNGKSPPVLSPVIWAMTSTGAIYTRGGISAIQPEGSEWVAMDAPKPHGAPVTKGSICTGSLFLVFLLMPDGTIYRRLGTSPILPSGQCWSKVATPFRASAITCSNTGLYVIDVDSKIHAWTEGIGSEQATPKFESIVVPSTTCFKFRHISVSWRGVLYVVSDEGDLFCRSSDQWVRLPSRGAPFSVVAVSPTFTAPIKRRVIRAWQQNILRMLKNRNEHENVSSDPRFISLPEKNHEALLNKRGILHHNLGRKWRKVHALLLRNTSKMYFEERSLTQDLNAPIDITTCLDVLDCTHVVAVDACTVPAEKEHTYQFTVTLDAGTVWQLSVGSETERNSWVASLLKSMNACILRRNLPEFLSALCFSRPSADAIFALDNRGGVWFCNHDTIDRLLLHAICWHKYPGYPRGKSWGNSYGWFRDIQASCSGVLWGIGDNERLYACDTAQQTWIPVPPFSNSRASIGCLCVSIEAAWVLTTQGVLFVRSHVRPSNPTGSAWIPLPHSPISKIYSVLGAVYAVNSYDDSLMKRKGFSRHHPYGTHWIRSNGSILPFEAPTTEDKNKEDTHSHDSFVVVPDTVDGKVVVDVCGTTTTTTTATSGTYTLYADHTLTCNGVLQPVNLNHVTSSALGHVYGVTTDGDMVYRDVVPSQCCDEWIPVPYYFYNNARASFAKITAAPLEFRAAPHNQPCSSMHVRVASGDAIAVTADVIFAPLEKGNEVVACVKEDEPWVLGTVAKTLEITLDGKTVSFVKVDTVHHEHYYVQRSHVVLNVPPSSADVLINTIVLVASDDTDDSSSYAYMQLLAKASTPDVWVGLLTRKVLSKEDIQKQMQPRIEVSLTQIRLLPPNAVI